MSNEVKIKLTDAQKEKIREATGQDLPEIRVENFGSNAAVSPSEKATGAHVSPMMRRGLSRKGLSKKGLSKKGLSKKGLSKKGLSKKGLSKKGLSRKGLSRKGLSRKGLSKKGFKATF
jgi:hypothetical protein